MALDDLASHPSPYLRLHADDPVDWHSWGPRVLQSAKQNNRLIYLSIGYFSCHWCHVMQRESYQDEVVGQYLNDHYVPVKIDRELRPELDRRMMAFVRTVHGSAGWPLHVFLTPDGYPVSGFTYMPKDEFLRALTALQSRWEKDRKRIEQVARRVSEQSVESGDQDLLQPLSAKHAEALISRLVSQALSKADELQGGFGDTSKFPSYPLLNALLSAVRLHPEIDPEITEFVQLTLNNMATLNLRDQVNGGFFRYTIDPDWQTPHFEKMLYDNAQLTLLYLEAESLWPDRGYLAVALDTLEFLEREMSDPSGGYASSLSAIDVDDVDGGAYVWTVSELQDVLSVEALTMMEGFGLLPEMTNESFLITGLDRLPRVTGNSIRDKLRATTDLRIPADEKKLASWNALVLLALLRAEDFTPEPQLHGTADQQFHFIRDRLVNGDEVRRFDGASDAAETTLEDAAYLARAITEYAWRRNDAKAANLASNLAENAFSRYFRNGRWNRQSDSLIPGDSGAWILADDVLESPVKLLLETVFMLDAMQADIKKLAGAISRRVTQDMLDSPTRYASAINWYQQYRAGIEINKP